MRLPLIAFVPTLVWISVFTPAMAQDTAGQLAFNNLCRTCHTLRAGDNRLGPSLYGVLGRKSGTLPNFGYSESMKKADIIWDSNNLDRFMANPDQVVPGNNMKPFSGIASPEDRAKIVSYLVSVSK
jgi:cytochrome c